MTPRLLPLRQRGVTLAEMLVTVAVIALAASIAVPNAGSSAVFAADAGASEVVSAIRFAQREAVRTGAWHAVRFDVAEQSLLVYRLTSAGVQDNAKTVFHPIDKAGYAIRFGAMGKLAAAEFKFKTRPVTNTLSFRPDGVPANINPSDLSVNLLELDGKVVLAQGGVQRSVAVARVTGRAAF